MPPKQAKLPKQQVPTTDADVLSDVLLRFTSTDLPANTDHPPACDQVRWCWLYG